MPGDAFSTRRPHADEPAEGPRELLTQFVAGRHAAAGSPAWPRHFRRIKRRTETAHPLRIFADHFSQAWQFFYSQTESEQNHVVSAFTFALSKVETKPVRERMVGQLANVDPGIAERVAKGLRLGSPVKRVYAAVTARTDLEPSPALSILAKAKQTMEGRKVGCLIAHGSDGRLIASLRAAAKKLKADFAIVAPRVGGAEDADGKLIEADFQTAGGSSVLFDAVFVALGAAGAAMLEKDAAAVAWVHDAYSHCKVIGATPDSQKLLDAAGATPDQGIIMGADPTSFFEAAKKGTNLAARAESPNDLLKDFHAELLRQPAFFLKRTQRPHGRAVTTSCNDTMLRLRANT